MTNSNDTITITPTQNESGTASFDVTVFDGGLNQGASATLPITITYQPVSQAPSLSITNTAPSGNAGSPIALPDINATLVDSSETLTVEITGLPSGYGVNKGNVDAGVWTLAANELTGLFITPPANASANLSLSVRAKSAESPSVFAYSAAVPVTVNVNGRPTGITLSGSQTAPETKNNFSVGTLGVADPDGDTVTNFAILPGPDAGNFRIDNGVLKTNTASLNYENTSDRIQQIRIRATDAGGLSVEQDFTITLSDINEKPEWTGALASNFPVNENIDIGSLNINLSGATDPENANVYYYFLLENGTVSGNPGGHLSINATPGKLSGQFDYEQIKDQGYFNESGGYVEVRYLATDKAISGTAIDYRADENYTTYTDVKRAAPQTLRITVNNVNDERPDNPDVYFEDLTGHFENDSSNIRVASFTRTDPDGPAPSLKLIGPDAGQFYTSGDHVYLRANRDAESTNSSVSLQVKATV